jgi:hypothetical protein
MCKVFFSQGTQMIHEEKKGKALTSQMPKQDEIDLVHKLLLHPAGYDIDIEGQLWVRRYEHPRWAVEWDQMGLGCDAVKGIEVKEFDDPLLAAEFFVEKRYEMQLGLDQ